MSAPCSPVKSVMMENAGSISPALRRRRRRHVWRCPHIMTHPPVLLFLSRRSVELKAFFFTICTQKCFLGVIRGLCFSPQFPSQWRWMKPSAHAEDWILQRAASHGFSEPLSDSCGRWRTPQMLSVQIFPHMPLTVHVRRSDHQICCSTRVQGVSSKSLPTTCKKQSLKFPPDFTGFLFYFHQRSRAENKHLWTLMLKILWE